MASISRLSLTPHFLYLHKYPSSSSSSLSIKVKLSTFCCLSATHSNDQIQTTPIDAEPELRIVFAAGGTGGHIYPAVAIADELKLARPSTKALFIGAPNSMESAAVPSAGFDFASVPAARLFRPLFNPRNLLFPYHLARSLKQCLGLLREFRPQIVVGTGGYVSFPICLAAAMIGSRVVIQEQNSVPGLANWVLSFFSDLVIVAFNSTIDCFPDKKKCVVCGNPVRLSLTQHTSKAEARLHFFPRSRRAASPEAMVVLVLGGSLGANAINIALLNLYYQMLLDDKNLYIIWQTGVHAYDEMESIVKNHPHLMLTPFLQSMDMAYSAADLIVSRAGAMTCYEILAAGKPCILIPSPNVAEGHQFKNASLMADLAGCKVITEDELDSTTLAIAIEEILGDESKMADMRERALKAANPNGSVEISQHILSLVSLSTPKAKQQQ